MMQHNNFTVIIPARMHSTRLPNKMVLLLNKIPLIVYTVNQALKSKAGRVIVATDHQDIISICKEHRIEAIMTHDTHTSGTERLAQAVNLLNLNADEIVINVQGDEPLIEPHLINQLADFIKKKQTEVATIAHPILSEDEIFNPHVVKVVLNKMGNALYFSRSPIPYYRDGFAKRNEFKFPQDINILRHIGIYAYTVKFLKHYGELPHCILEQVECLEQLRVLYNGYNISVLETSLTHEAGVDTLEDLQRIRQLINNKESHAATR
ncbi:MAG: 3-deoxy-manno-octulosonate cytidylyltransferase [Burkholderiales bacterium]|nr:3-deoxy-manno-octulosonate cytidylyltransferase [Burkholderiales bacterium]